VSLPCEIILADCKTLPVLITVLSWHVADCTPMNSMDAYSYFFLIAELSSASIVILPAATPARGGYAPAGDKRESKDSISMIYCTHRNYS